MTARIQRAQTTTEFELFRELLVEYEQSLPPDLRHDLKAPEVRMLGIEYDEPNAAFLALVDRVAAGCVALTTLDASTGVIKRLYVKRAYRQLGIARTLLTAAIQFAREQRHLRVVLDTDRERLHPAYKLYLELGFVECEPYGSVDYICPTYMELRLQ